MENETEQWKSDGDCKKCRREPFCRKPCKAKKERGRSVLADAVAGLFLAAMINNGRKKK